MITVTRQTLDGTAHVVRIRAHELTVDMGLAAGGGDAGPDPHDLYDAALGACKALTVLWYARREAIPLEEVEVAVRRDGSGERDGVYRLQTVLSLGGDLDAETRARLLGVAAKCPVHKLMTSVTTEIDTVLSEAY